ncbi:MAG: type VI secretion system baseplate subunit TssG, partial [Desulfobacterales bacterium]|nr:type VI secretion system baseplate subunit TssG [Desulfobacterales bacterium]
RSLLPVSTTTGLTSNRPGLLDQLHQNPGRWQFAQAIRVLLNTAHKSQVSLRLVSDPDYSYTCRELTGATRERNHWQLSTTLPSLTGIHGVLPYGYQDQAHQLRVGEDNSGLQDFYGIFNQRILLNSYRCSTRNHLVCRFEQGILQQRQKPGNRVKKLPLGEQLCALAGVARPRMIPADQLVRYVGLLGQKTRSTVLLGQMLEDFFEVSVSLEKMSLRKHQLDDDCRSKLSSLRSSCNTLGNGALLGNSTWLPNNRFRLVITARDHAHKQRIEKDPQLLQQIQEFCDLFLGHSVSIDMCLRCTVAMIPAPQLTRQRKHSVKLGLQHSLQSGRDPQKTVLMALVHGINEHDCRSE